MFGYLFLCMVLFNMILVSKTWPRETRKDTDNMQSDRIYFPTKTDDGSKNQVNVQKRHIPEVTQRTRVGAADDDDEIVFPTHSNPHHITPPPDNRKDYSAVGKGLNCIKDVCEEAEDYPGDHIKKVIGALPYYSNLFGAGAEGVFIDTSNRGAETEEISPLCTTTMYTKYPKVLKNENKTEKYIVNEGEHKQGITFEVCVETEKPCPKASFPDGYEHQCVQKFSTVRLLALEKEGGNPAFDKFVIPSCCVCNIKKPKT